MSVAKAMPTLLIPFADFPAMHQPIAAALKAAAARVIDSGWYVLGPEVEAFEQEFADYHHGTWGRMHAVGVGTGTDAIELSLRALNIGPGDEVITVSHTAAATVRGIERAGAKPVLVDIDPRTMTIDVDAAAAAVNEHTRAIVPVHLYGGLADIEGITKVAQRHGLAVIEDCAQAQGATLRDRPVGTFGTIAAFSFYPTKTLGALGDAGAVLTRDRRLAERVRRLRCYGQSGRYEHVERGINSRLDEMQAAMLRVKLARFDEDLQIRKELAQAYRDGLLGSHIRLQNYHAGHAYHLFVVRSTQRDRLREHLKTAGIGTEIHYPVPVHRQAAYRDLRREPLPHTEAASREVMSLPLYPGLTVGNIETIIDAVRGYVCQEAAA